ncbi:MAG: hypothetical protein LAT68_17035 [Cyclobacteriaceae bacterium]|nr:hypothetical protein [Cyclobacteriaceae bacterium]
MKRKSIVFLVFFVTIVIILTFMLSEWRIEHERNLDVNFKVAKVEITPAFRVILYDKDQNKLSLQRFVLYDYHDVKPGDLIVKEAGAEVLKVYRIDSLENKTVHLKINID